MDVISLKQYLKLGIQVYAALNITQGTLYEKKSSNIRKKPGMDVSIVVV